jgi:hypothetical protein
MYPYEEKLVPAYTPPKEEDQLFLPFNREDNCFRLTLKCTGMLEFGLTGDDVQDHLFFKTKRETVPNGTTGIEFVRDAKSKRRGDFLERTFAHATDLSGRMDDVKVEILAGLLPTAMDTWMPNKSPESRQFVVNDKIYSWTQGGNDLEVGTIIFWGSSCSLTKLPLQLLDQDDKFLARYYQVVDQTGTPSLQLSISLQAAMVGLMYHSVIFPLLLAIMCSYSETDSTQATPL